MVTKIAFGTTRLQDALVHRQLVQNFELDRPRDEHLTYMETELGVAPIDTGSVCDEIVAHVAQSLTQEYPTLRRERINKVLISHGSGYALGETRVNDPATLRFDPQTGERLTSQARQRLLNERPPEWKIEAPVGYPSTELSPNGLPVVPIYQYAQIVTEPGDRVLLSCCRHRHVIHPDNNIELRTAEVWEHPRADHLLPAVDEVVPIANTTTQRTQGNGILGTLRSIFG